MGEISKHPEMGKIISSIRKIAEDIPCEKCITLKDDLNGAKSREKHWKQKYDEQSQILEGQKLPKETMRVLCGGAFPLDPNGFNFEEVPEWRFKNNKWVPYDYEQPITGPYIKFTINLINGNRSHLCIRP